MRELLLLFLERFRGFEFVEGEGGFSARMFATLCKGYYI